MSALYRRLGSREAKPNPDAFWSDKWGWMDEASAAGLIAEIRSRVESGTIKGKVAESWHMLNADYVKVDEPGTYLVILDKVNKAD